MKKSFDIEGKETVYEYDGNGDVTSVTGPDGKTVSYIRGNCCGSVDTLVDAAGNKTHWKHDVLGRTTEKWLKWDLSNPGGGGAVRVQLLTYDAVGRPVTKTDARGNVRTVTYDNQGRMNAINYSIAGSTKATSNVGVTYEPVFGRVQTVTDGTGTHTYGYVPFNSTDMVYGDGGLASITTAGNAGFASATHSYTYDALGRKTGANLAGAARAWTFDALGRLTHYISPLGDEEVRYVGKTGRVDWTKIGALKTAYGYTADSEHRLTGIGHTWNDAAVSSHAYGYDGVGRLTSWAKTWGGVTKTWTMGYDASEQLETVSETVGTVQTDLHHYTYDDAGNRLSDQRGGGVRSWVANAFNQLTQQTVGGEMELRGTVTPKSKVKIDNQPAQMFDEQGQPAASGKEWRIKRNAASGQNNFALKATEDAPPGFVPQVANKTVEVNIQPAPQLTYAYDADGNMTTDGIASYEWDAENRLVTVISSPMGRVEFVYDAFSRRVRIIEKAPGTLAVEADKKLVWDGTEIVQQFDSIGNSLRQYFGHGETREAVGVTPVVVMEYLYTRDHLGSIRQLLEKNSGSQGALYDYSPYGVQTVLQGSVPSDFGYTGHYTNAKSGLVLAPYRAYSPELGRWISRDPIEEDGGINLYGYVGNGPLGAVDPLGLAPPPPTADGGANSFLNSAGSLRKTTRDKNTRVAIDAMMDALARSWKANYGNGTQGNNKHNVGKYMCWDWAYSFESTVNSVLKDHPKAKLSIERIGVQNPGKTDDGYTIHFGLKILIEGGGKGKCYVLDDGFGTGNVVHTLEDFLVEWKNANWKSIIPPINLESMPDFQGKRMK